MASPDDIPDDASDDGFMADYFGADLPDGVKKEVMTPGGTNSRTPKPGDDVSVHYVGTLEADGSEFDSSRGRGEPFLFTLGQGQVIKGWDLGVATMKVGEIAKLTISSDYAYGDMGSPPKIPGGATLVFEVELLSFNAKDDLFQDGGVIKSKLKDGVGFKKPKCGDEVRLDLKVTATNGDVVDERSSFEYILGSGVLGTLSKAIDKILVEMKKDEQVQLVCSKDYAYGDRTPDGATVSVTLVHICETKDVSLAKDKSLMKKTVSDGEGYDTPKECAKVKLKVDSATDGSKDIPGFAQKTLEFVVGNGDVCDALECTVGDMKAQEKAVLTCTRIEQASEAQLGLQDLASEKVVLVVELLSFEKPQETWHMNEDEKLEYAAGRKEIGSKLFRANRTRMALERYKKVTTLFSNVDKLRDEIRVEAKELRKVCELNSAACQLKLKDFTEAKRHCNNALQEDSLNVKAFFRRAQANIGLKLYMESIADLKKNLEIEPQNREARALLKEAQAGQKQEDKKSQGLFSKMCGGLGKGPIPPPAVAKSFVPPDRPPAASPSDELLEKMQQSQAPTMREFGIVKENGRVGEILSHDAADPELHWKLQFGHHADWFREDAVEQMPLTGSSKVPSSWLTARAAFFAAPSLILTRRKDWEALFEAKAEAYDAQAWSVDRTAVLGEEGDEARFESRVDCLKKDVFTSIAGAVSRLNSPEGHVACQEGLCVVFSQSRKLYFLLYKTDQKREAFGIFGLTSPSFQHLEQAASWHLEQTAAICGLGEEAMFEGKARLLDKEEFNSVSYSVNRLSDGSEACPEGFCVVFSSRVEQYMLLYRDDKKAEAMQIFNLIEEDGVDESPQADGAAES